MARRMYSFPQPCVQLGEEKTPALPDAISEGMGGNAPLSGQAQHGSGVEPQKVRGFVCKNESLFKPAADARCKYLVIAARGGAHSGSAL
jgi:hypothetical protein